MNSALPLPPLTELGEPLAVRVKLSWLEFAEHGKTAMTRSMALRMKPSRTWILFMVVTLL